MNGPPGMVAEPRTAAVPVPFRLAAGIRVRDPAVPSTGGCRLALHRHTSLPDAAPAASSGSRHPRTTRHSPRQSLRPRN